MKTWLYVDRDAIMSKRAPLIVRREGQRVEQHAWEVAIDGPSVLRFVQCGPVPAKVYVETESPVTIVRPE